MDSTNSNNMFDEVFTRLRETEAQTREQCVQIKSLCDRLDNFSTITNKFFDLEEKRNAESEKRLKDMLEHEQRREDRTEAREKNFWKIIAVLIGTLVISILGPKVAKELLVAHYGQSTVIYQEPWALPTDKRTLDIFFFQRQDDNIA